MRSLHFLFVLGCLGPLLAGCAQSVLRAVAADERGGAERLGHPALGYRIDRPDVLDEPGWQIQSLDSADLYLAHESGASFALTSECRSTAASPAQLARQLARAADGGVDGVSGRRLVHHGLPGFRQRLTRREDGRRVRVETVTLRGVRCTYDLIAISPEGPAQAELADRFDRWWRSFVPATRELAEDGRARRGAGVGVGER